MTTRTTPSAAHREIEREHVAATGSDNFDTPAVALKVRELAGLKTSTPEELFAVAERAIAADTEMDDAHKDRALARARWALFGEALPEGVEATE